MKMVNRKITQMIMWKARSTALNLQTIIQMKINLNLMPRKMLTTKMMAKKTTTAKMMKNVIMTKTTSQYMISLKQKKLITSLFLKVKNTHTKEKELVKLNLMKKNQRMIIYFLYQVP